MHFHAIAKVMAEELMVRFHYLSSRMSRNSCSFLFFKHRQHIAGGVFKPRYRRAPTSENPLFVLAALKVDLQTHTTRGQVIFYLALFERLFALAFTARAIPS